MKKFRFFKENIVVIPCFIRFRAIQLKYSSIWFVHDCLLSRYAENAENAENAKNAKNG